jgi:hypothetical protein
VLPRVLEKKGDFGSKELNGESGRCSAGVVNGSAGKEVEH